MLICDINRKSSCYKKDVDVENKNIQGGGVGRCCPWVSLVVFLTYALVIAVLWPGDPFVLYFCIL